MNEKAGRILVVDDEKNLCEYLSIILQKEGFAVDTANTARAALAFLDERDFDLVIADVKMEEMDGIELLERIKARDETLPVVIITAYSTWNLAVEAMRLGACDFIKKPFKNRIIKEIAHRLVAYRREYRMRLPSRARGGADAIYHLAEIIGNSPRMDEVFSRIELAARTEATVLLSGESGTGKELAARALHYGSLRKNENFISINCSSLVSTLLESEIFGYARGAFTGADKDKKGLLELADGGTFFLDEIGDLDIELQGKILKVLEEREFYPVGSTEKKYVDVRFVAATNQNLEELIASRRFREDLYYRLNVLRIHLPPLRERKEDIPLLAGYFIKKYAARYGKPVTEISEEALQALGRYAWPGNIRELENCIHSAVITTRDEVIDTGDLPALGTRDARERVLTVESFPEQGFDLEKHLQRMEKEYIEEALRRCDFNITRAARLLGTTFRSLRYKIKKHGIARKHDGGHAR